MKIEFEKSSNSYGHTRSATATPTPTPTAVSSSSNRKRALSNPHIASTPDGRSAGLQPHLAYYYDKSHSGRSSFCVDESLWHAATAAASSDSNLYATMPAEGGAVAEIEDSEEAIDQFSPTLYSRLSAAKGQGPSRAIPIPSSSAGNSPQHQLHHPLLHQHYHHQLHLHHHSTAASASQPYPSQYGHHGQRSLSSGSAAPAAVAAAAAAAAAVGYMASFSASPTGHFVHAYSPLYGSSPDTLSSPTISFGYDPEFGPGIHRLQVPPQQQQQGHQQQHPQHHQGQPHPREPQRSQSLGSQRSRSPLDCATVMAVNRSVRRLLASKTGQGIESGSVNSIMVFWLWFHSTHCECLLLVLSLFHSLSFCLPASVTFSLQLCYLCLPVSFLSVFLVTKHSHVLQVLQPLVVAIGYVEFLAINQCY